MVLLLSNSTKFADLSSVTDIFYQCLFSSHPLWSCFNCGDQSADVAVIMAKKAVSNQIDLTIAGGLALNLCCSISIVFLNKWLYSKMSFPNMTLTCIHFFATSFGLYLCQLCNVFSPKKLPYLQIFPLSVTFCGFVVFTNLSLQHNTVGTYQLAKVLTTPVIIIIQTYFFDTTFSKSIKGTLVRSLWNVVNLSILIAWLLSTDFKQQ